MTILHSKFGRGTVLGYTEYTILIKFDKYGIKEFGKEELKSFTIG